MSCLEERRHRASTYWKSIHHIAEFAVVLRLADRQCELAGGRWFSPQDRANHPSLLDYAAALIGHSVRHAEMMQGFSPQLPYFVELTRCSPTTCSVRLLSCLDKAAGCS